MARLSTFIFWGTGLCLFVICQYAIYSVSNSLSRRLQGIMDGPSPEVQATGLALEIVSDAGNSSNSVQPFILYQEQEFQLTQAVPGFLVLVIQVIYMFQYKAKVVDMIQVNLNNPPVEYGLCGCFEDCDACLQGWCCGLARLSHSSHVLGVMDYWPTCGLLCVASSCGCGLGGLCFLTYIRMKIKEKLGMLPNAVEDFCVMCWCTCCAIIQQGRDVDQRMGVKTSFCCNLQQNMLAAPQMAGHPAAAGAQTMMVMCPEGVGPGTQLHVQTPIGTTVQVAVPQGVQPGQQFQIQLPPQQQPMPV